MTSREIIIKLIDEHKITGEETYTLLNDIFKGEMVAVNEILKTSSSPSTINNDWLNNFVAKTSNNYLNGQSAYSKGLSNS